MTSNASAPGPEDGPDRLRAVTQVMQALIALIDETTATTGNALVAPLQPWLEPITATIGKVVSPMASLPLVQSLTMIPGIKWLLAALGQVNVATVRQEVDDLRQNYPQENRRTLAQRVMADTALKAAGVGLATNLAPPVAVSLTLVDIGAVAALQANMIYRIASIYGYPPEESDRRGEVLAIWLLSSSTSGLVKSGLSFLEVVPALGAAVGIATDATLIYSVGYLACRYYETKRSQPTEIPINPEPRS
ncbi:MAG TPA: DUF697 domain-containing protein [Leptolyngbyaceae cyanobacterium M65_K2018_010]|nr:DUF697 domain-containing protein [Leptolyngbyaceae cyanobacterium M65_K2018_010]